MKPFHLQVNCAPASSVVLLRWFGASALHPEGARELARNPDSTAIFLPSQFLIDLNPVQAEVAAGSLVDAAGLAESEELRQLRPLLTLAGFDDLCETLFRFLYRESQSPGGLESSRGPKIATGAEPGDYDGRIVRVWFGTDRRPLVGYDVAEGFSAFNSSDEITYGVCNVLVPQSHAPGSTGSPWWRRWFVLREDDRLRIQSLHGLERELFWKTLSGTLQTDWNAGDRNLFVLIHGFNVSFEESAVRAAQIGYDLKLPGEMAFYAWPSRGETADYMADEATITASAAHIATFLHELSTRSGAERIHLMVHSMGNRGLLSALETIAARAQPKLRLGQVFFCAPDEDVRTFRHKVTNYRQIVENQTLLVSADDRAVGASSWLRNQDRVGLVPPVLAYPGVETIEVGGFGLLDLGHGYFAETRALIEDMREAIATRKPAAQRKIPRPNGTHFLIDVRTKI